MNGFVQNMKAGAAKKALLAAVTALLGSFATALSDGDLSVAEIGVALLTAGAAVVAVYQVPNEPTVAE